MKKAKNPKFNILVKKFFIAIALLAVSAFALVIDIKYMVDNSMVAAAGETFPISEGTCTINSSEDLINFSKAYKSDPSTYQNVKISIAITSGALTNLQDFESIGTADYPFSGNLIFASSSNSIIALDKPFFAYLSDSCKITDSDGNIKEINFSRTSKNNSSLFAENVVNDAGNTETVNWKIVISPYSEKDDDKACDFGGIIGTIGKDADVNLTIKNNAVAGSKYADITNSGNAGLACGTMKGNSALTVTIDESSTNTGYSVTSTGGHAGGIVGAMESGSTLTVNSSVNASGEIKSENGYAGGVVGYATDATVNFVNAVSVNATVNGSSGTGGAFGYYNNTAENREFDVSKYSIDCTLNGVKNGGLFGVLANSGSMTITDSSETKSSKINPKRTAIENKENYGGLIGTYSSDATSNTLSVSDMIVKVDKTTGKAGNYGGVIGEISGASYVKFNNVTVNANNCSSNVDVFGGLVGKVSGGFVDAQNVTIKTNGNFNGGGIVGNLDSGVLRLKGQIDVSGAGEGSFVVGTRGQALVYAESGWKLIRKDSSGTNDTIYTWGDVLRFGGANLSDVKQVLDVDETAHTVKVLQATPTAISSTAEFAKLALNIQLNTGSDFGTLLFDDKTNSTSSTLLSSIINLTGNIDLTGTGLTGLTRDDGANDAFTGTFDGGNNTITLATGEKYGYKTDENTPVTIDDNGNGKIYHHQYNGLFAKTSGGATFRNLTLKGSINVNGQGISNENYVYIGGLSAYHHTGAITINSVTASEKIENLDGGTNKYILCGGLVGAVGSTNSNDNCAPKITIENNTKINPKITTVDNNSNNKIFIGGAIGEIRKTSGKINVTADNVKLNATVENSSKNSDKKTGGFIAYIGKENTNSSSERKISMKNITIDGTTVTSTNNNNLDVVGGGLLGQEWNNIEVTIGEKNENSEVINGITVQDSTVSYDGSKGLGGLVTIATGYWKVYNIDINSIAVYGSNAKSFGMLVNNGFYVWKEGSTPYPKALYLELENADAYKITSATLTGLNESATFDELVADCRNYSLSGNDKVYSDISANGNAVVSIHTSGDKVIMDGTNCNTYQNQTNFTTKVNPNTRYYYNLDVIRNNVKNNTATAPEKLLLWSVNKYAYDNIQKYFSDSFNGIIPSGEYDMTGYSYYPVDVSGVTVSSGAKFTFCNDKIKNDEKTTTNSNSQHYLMHCGLFRNVTGNLNVNGTTFSGNVGKVGTDYCGALVCGTISTDSTTPVSVSVDGVTLNGIKVNGGDTAEYAPLLINIINKNTTLTLSDVKTPANGYADGAVAATSLIGDVGNSTDADNIKLTFSNIVLDGRKTAVSDSTADSALNSAYNTTRSIITKATLLNKYQYQTGKNCSAVYNFKHEEDWGADGNTATHKVTYGTEISDSAEYTEIGQQKQYIDTEDYTDPTTSNATSVYNFSTEFLPYVATPYSTANNTHEIKVNHKSGEGLEKGCGTYNDPYIIETAKQLELVADILNEGSSLAAGGTVVNWHGDNYKSWCSSDHITYKYDAEQSIFVNESDSSDTKTLTEMQTALSTAYYKIDNNEGITLPDSFIGLGKTVAFKGVIWGAGSTITNKSTNPLIYNSTGSVVKDLNVNVTADFLNSFKSVTANTTYETDGSNGKTPFYGGIFGIVNGGDNIIDNVSVTIDNAKNISPTGTNPGNVAVGGYVGVVRYGGVIFRNMSGAAKPDFSQNTKFGAVKSGSVYLYLNPIIGRVIDGYAVTETSKYTPREENNPTMQNGTKNYSIADINKDSSKITFNGTTISVPDGQALFLMGCIAMSGAGSANTSNNQYPATYSYGNNQMVRFAEYNSIGTNDNSNSDFAKAKGDNYANTAVPYIINHYTNDTTSARKLTTGTFSIELTGTGDYTLPDGFRGIGSMNNSSDNLKMHLTTLNGHNATVTMNSSFYAYSLYDDYDNYYTTVNKSTETAAYKRCYTQNVGLGLFNSIYIADNGASTIKDLTLKGKTTVKIYNINGTQQSSDQKSQMCAGMLIGVVYNKDKTITLNINNVYLGDSTSETSVDTRFVSGGLIGIISNNKNSSAVNFNNCDADNITINGGYYSGGLVGYNYNPAINISESNYTDIKIISNSSGGGWGHSTGTGGVVGLSAGNITVNNVNVKNGTIKSNAEETFVGGVIGCTGISGGSKTRVCIDGANVENVSLNDNITQKAYVGGIVAGTRAGTKDSYVKNCTVTGGENNIINGHQDAGGIIATAGGPLTVDNCKVKNYIIQTAQSGEYGEGGGGFFGKVENGTTIFTNSSISNCTVEINVKSGNTNYYKSIGGAVGNICSEKATTLSGYNIVIDNVQVKNSSTYTKVYMGDIVGELGSKSRKLGNVKLVGVSLHKKQGESYTYADSDVGTYGNNTDNYIIYSDFEGKCLEGTPNSTVSIINNANNVTDMGHSPYATINPVVKPDGTMILTGDGISLTAISGIIADSTNYTNVATDRTTFANYKAKLSTFNKKTGAGLANDFPVLVINDSNYQNVTAMINSYIHLLTNDTSIDNYANADSAKCKVVLAPYRLEETSFVTKAEYAATLKMENGYFRMTDSDYDSSHQQFTLIDIQYLAPNDTSKIAYHLYIPVYVEKMLKFNFTIGALSGTTYNTRFYKDGEPVLESYGTPVTAHITYSYLRTAQEWQDAINNGENVLKGYGKSITMSEALPENTKLVLVDRNNGDKAYYSDITAALYSNGKIDLSKFTASDSTAFSPVSFIDLLNKSAQITATEDNTNGTLVKCSESDKALATVKIGEDYYRKKTDSDSESFFSVKVTPYTAMVDSGDILKVYDDYYISFFTVSDADALMKNITVSCPSRLGDDGMTPSRMNNVNAIESMVHIILGNLYDQNFTFQTTGNELINDNNKTVPAELSTTVSLKQATAEEVKSYLNSSSIHLYHGFIIEAARKDETGTENGVKGSPQITGTYKIGDTSYSLNFSNTEPVITLTGNDENGVADIKQYLISNGSVKITCSDLQITYNDEASIIEQFPERKTQTSGNGVVFSANSNLAYVQDDIEYSNISESSTDTRPYYRENITAASLNYNIPSDSPDEMIKLGINGRESNDDITAVGYYNVMNLSAEDLNKAAKVKFTLSLYRKNGEGTYDPVNINDYLERIKLYGKDGTGQSVTSDNDSCYYIFGKDDLNYEAGSFEVVSTYSVKTGAAFENESKIYANYKVQLTAQLLDTDDNPLENTGCSDYIIYTNAKIFTEMLPSA